MSTAIRLPYVWATASETSARSREARKPMGGLVFYRRRTESLLRRYLRASLAVGRVPSSVAGDMTLRGRATSYRMKNFEDVVIFSIDVERCLKSLEAQARQLVVKIAIQEYMFLEAAEQMGLDARTVARRYGDALDQLTAEFIKKKLLTEDEEKWCQEG